MRQHAASSALFMGRAAPAPVAPSVRVKPGSRCPMCSAISAKLRRFPVPVRGAVDQVKVT